MPDQTSTFSVYVLYGSRPIQLPREGETHRQFLKRAGHLRVRKNGELDMRFRSSKAVVREEAA